MIDETKALDKATRGKRADDLLKDEILSDAFKKLEADYFKAWAGTHPAEGLARENYWRAVQILGDVRKQLITMAADGRVAQRDLDQLGGLNRL